MSEFGIGGREIVYCVLDMLTFRYLRGIYGTHIQQAIGEVGLVLRIESRDGCTEPGIIY